MTETERISFILRENAMTDLDFFAKCISEWKFSPERMKQLQGEAYFIGKHDILKRKRELIGRDGKMHQVDNLPNNRLVDNQYALLVDKKKNYVLGKDFLIDSESKEVTEALQGVFDSEFKKKIGYACKDFLNNGISWIMPYYSSGKLLFSNFSGFEILPFWEDDTHEILNCALRLYEIEEYTKTSKKIIEKVELFTKTGVTRYEFDGDTLTQDGKEEPYISEGEKAYHWGVVPLIPFRYNKQERPLLCKVKSLQDSLNLVLSDYMNAMQEQGTFDGLFVVSGYGRDGNDISFQEAVALKHVIYIRNDEELRGKVEKIQTEVNSENFLSIRKMLREAIIENGLGYDAKDERTRGTPNQMNIQSMYSDIELDSAGIEIEWRASMKKLLEIIYPHFSVKFDLNKVTFSFDKDLLMNERELVDSLRASVGMISDESIVRNHPFVQDPEEELHRIKQEKNLDLYPEYSQSLNHNHGVTGVEA